MGTLYQPLHRTRLRHSSVTFKQDGDRLTGYSLTPEGEGLSGDKEWPDGRTEFRTVTFADSRLVFEFDVQEVRHGWGLGVKNKGVIRVEAKLQGDRLIGKWGLFLKDGSEPFRGEWEAVRAKAPEKPVEPLQSKYKVGEQVPLLWEYRVTGARAGQEGALVCTFMYQPFVAVFCRDMDAAVIRLIKKIDEATAKSSTRLLPPYEQRLGSYVVLICDSKAREKELKALAEKEKIQHTILALGAKNEGLPSNEAYWRNFDAGLGEAEITVLLAGPPRARIKVSYAYRKGELTDKAIEQILADLPKILPKKD